MAFSSWFCTNSTKNMLVKIVHPGGHAEIHDRPVVAAEIMLRNPKCVVAHPNVFQQPWAIVAPDTTLQLGKKYYVVPVSTIRKLQRRSFRRNSPFRLTEDNNRSGRNVTSKDDQEEFDSTNTFTCWNALKAPCSCLKHSDDDKGARSNPSSNDKRNNNNDVSKDNCCMCLLTRMKIVKGNNGEDSGELEMRSSSSSVTSETRGLTGRRINDFTRRLPPRRSATLDHWQPNLESITEDQSNN